MTLRPLLLTDLYASSLLLDQSPYKVFRCLPPGGLDKQDAPNSADRRSDCGTDACQLEISSPSDGLVHPVKMTVHKSILLSIIGLP